MNIEQFKEIFKSYPQLTEEKLITRKQACVITASLFPPSIGVKVMKDYNSTLPEYKNDYYESIAHMYCDGFMHYGLNDMINYIKNK